MNTYQENKLAMARAVRAVCQGSTATAGIKAFPAAFAAFNARLDSIEAHARRQAAPLRPKLDERRQQETEMIDAALVIAAAVSTYADQAGLKPLAAQVRVTTGDFNRARPPLRVRLAQQICDAVRPLTAQLADHGVSAVALDALQEKIDAAQSALPVPRQFTAEKKASTAEIVTQMKGLHAILRNQLDPLMLTLRKPNPAFYNEYRAARQILNLPGVRVRATTPADAPAASSIATPAATPQAA